MRQLLACNRGVITSQKWSKKISQASFHSQNRRSASISVGYATAQYATRRLLACFTEELKVIVHLLSSISDDWTRNWGPQPCHSASAHFRHWIRGKHPTAVANKRFLLTEEFGLFSFSSSICWIQTSMGGVARIGGTHFTLAGMRHGQRSVILINAMLCTYLPPLLVSGDFSWGAREIQWLDLEFHYFCVDKSYSLMTCNKDIHSARLVCLFFALGKSLGVFEVAYYQRSGLSDMYR